jgi:hypothetical protein
MKILFLEQMGLNMFIRIAILCRIKEVAFVISSKICSSSSLISRDYEG